MGMPEEGRQQGIRLRSRPSLEQRDPAGVVAAGAIQHRGTIDAQAGVLREVSGHAAAVGAFLLEKKGRQEEPDQGGSDDDDQGDEELPHNNQDGGKMVTPGVMLR